MSSPNYTHTAGSKDCQRHRVQLVSYEAVPKYPASRHSLEIKEEIYRWECKSCGQTATLICEPIQTPDA